MEIKKRGNLAAICMLLGGMPLSGCILLYFNMMSARKSGRPYDADALGLMMVSVAAYGIAVLSFIAGTVSFCVLLFRRKFIPSWWQQIIFIYSLGQLMATIIYFSWL